MFKQSLKDVIEYEEEIKKSRFLVRAAPVSSAEECLPWIHTHSDMSATHNCWAFRVGDIYRFSDDGEPGGSAGKPILNAIDGQNCDAVAVLVIRWFGGVKLGVGGLMRAYGGTAANALRLAEKIPLIPKVMLDFFVLYAELAVVQAKLKQFAAQTLQEQFNEHGAQLQIRLDAQDEADFCLWLHDMTRGRETPSRSE